METKEICILVTNNDVSCRDFLVDTLQHQRCTYEELYVGNCVEVVNAILERKDKVGFILTIVNKLNIEDLTIIQNIHTQFNLPTISISHDNNAKNVLEGERSSFRAYIVNFFNETDVNKFWEYSKKLEASSMRSTPESQVHGNEKKRKEAKEENDDSDDDDNHIAKKPRVVWTKDLHEKFLSAINHLGHERAFPKKIVEVMNVPHLTRENVASHLQKHRMGLKRAQEYSLDSTYGMSLASDTKQPYFSSTRSFSDFTYSQGYSHHTRYQPLHAPRYSFDLDTTRSTYRSFSRELEQKNTYKNNGDLQCIDQSRYSSSFTRNRNFRVYNDQRKNVLYSLKSDLPIAPTSFHGFRLTNDGESIEFGSNSSIKKSDIQFPSTSIIGNENVSQYLCTPTTSHGLLDVDLEFQQQPFLPLLEENLGQISWFPENQLIDNYSSTSQPLYQAPGDEISGESSTMAANNVFQHQPSTFEISENKCTSTIFEHYPEMFSLFDDHTTFQNPASTYIHSTVSGKESSPPPLSPETLLHEIDSFVVDGELDALLNVTESPSINPDGFWNDEIDELLSKINQD